MANRFSRHSVFDIKSKPQTLLGFGGFIMVALSFFPPETGFDINFHDTYIVIASATIYRFFAALLLFLWSVYIMANRLRLSAGLSWVHVIVTLLFAAFFVSAQYHIWGFGGLTRRYYAFDSFQGLHPLYIFSVIYLLMMAILCIGQIILIINLLLGVIRFNRKNKSLIDQ